MSTRTGARLLPKANLKDGSIFRSALGSVQIFHRIFPLFLFSGKLFVGNIIGCKYEKNWGEREDIPG